MVSKIHSWIPAAAVVAAMTVPAQAAEIPIVIYDAADGIASDSSGMGNDGLATGAGVSVVAAGPNAGDMSFSFVGGLSTDRITTNATGLLNNPDVIAAGGFTMSAWINTTGTDVGDFGSVIDYAGTERIQFNAAGEIGFAISGVEPQVYSTVNVTDGQWHFVLAQFVVTDGSDPTAVVGDMYITVDGVTNSINGQTLDTFGDSLVRPIGIGGHPVGFAGDVYAGLINDPTVALGTSVPEPGSLALLGLAGLGLMRRRRR